MCITLGMYPWQLKNGEAGVTSQTIDQSSFCWIYLPRLTLSIIRYSSPLSHHWASLSFQPDDPTVAARISGCLADISAWMKEHHLQLNLAKTELLVFPAAPTLQHDITIQLGSSTITPSTSVRNLGVIFDDQLTFKDHIAKTARSCRFALHNIRKIRPFLTEHAAQLQLHDWSSRNPKEPMLHLSLSHCIGYQSQLASSSRH
ncbi:uncharacterized protein LOC131546549 [Onychostoma macrolepis]|uniref:uncharacterized protein LOC131546549 n=1 Tax=Onychostoma macrolepis TaxID=369639 RepID=UPI002729E651|nr:uncharacterized protein LOC131546549 [Onychostoma macrolepis]